MIKMNISMHFLVSLFISIVLFPVFGYYSLIMVIAGGVIIDIDHYFWYACKYRKFGLIRAYKFYLNKHFAEKNVLHIFHSIEFLLLCTILSFFSVIILLFTVGLIVHNILDMIFI